MKPINPAIKTGRLIILFLILCTAIENSFSQDTIVHYIFVPHPRNDDQMVQGSLKAIEQIDFSKYKMIFLGGDLAYHTSSSIAALQHCDSIFNLGSENTLWTVGNHDLANPGWIEDYTHRPRFYATNKNNITFIVLDTEIGSNAFVSSHITQPQVDMIENVIDTVVNSKYLIFLHHRLLWMIGNPYFAPKIDSVGESTRQLDTSNFNTVVFPLLQQAKSKGKQVICLGGDKSKINFQYSPEDSITYIASTMGPEFADSVNHVVILTHDLISDSIWWNYVPLSTVEKKQIVINDIENLDLQPANITANCLLKQIEINLQNELTNSIRVNIYDISGRNIGSYQLQTSMNKFVIPFANKGVYVIELNYNNKRIVQKLIF